ncbi:Hsp70 family protein [Dactylosporangium matsuzakiense]|uniref:Hsp70 protein n=1 Tax=Dactylosporangium matsuzakiense TaxID=53360 RepID=A0A9W6KS92_9ACTN|nr:Hsp70 family protein [Dactylosporangium matsuzakiense]UWZ43656.1 Hsp70 family protein [Dactylosporangium matsuzakiense]GLL04554.1 hypothetical protein GCM10017581_063010 [Dactylosporangium matsuzakiense]
MYRLSIDFGTSTTVAMLGTPDGRIRPLLFDASPLLPSAVLADDEGLLVGGDAQRAAVGAPGAFEANPKRRIDDGVIWLGEREYAVPEVIAAVFERVAVECVRVAGRPAAAVVLTHPAAWAQTRLAVLADAAARARLGPVSFVAEPVAAAQYFASVLQGGTAPGRSLVVYDLGAGTFDVTVVRPGAGGFEVAASDGLPDVGGLDLDAAVVAHAQQLTSGAADAWQRLNWPQTPADQQARQTLWLGARAVKEQLSRHATGDLQLPLVDKRLHLTRHEFEEAARPYLERTAALTLQVLRTAAVSPESIGAVLLVGGSSRVPLASTLLHRTLRIAPTVIDQPELVVAEGALHRPAVTRMPQRPSAPPAGAPPPHRGPTTAPAVPAQGSAPAQVLVPGQGPASVPPMDGRTAASNLPVAPSGKSRNKSVALLAGVATLLVAVIIVGAIWRPWQSKTGGSDNSTSGSPAAVLTQYIDARFKTHNAQLAQRLQCTAPQLSAVDDLVNTLEQREAQLGVTITVDTANLNATVDGTNAEVTSDLTLSTTTRGQLQTAIEHWRFDLVQASGWHVCSAERSS